MISCFDTSAINRLHSDIDREAIVAGILASGPVYVSALSVLEAAKTRSEQLRLSLLNLQKRLAAGIRPLELPTVLIRRGAEAFSKGEKSTTISIGEENDGLWIGLQHPEKIGEIGHKESCEWSAKLEEEFTVIHRNARPHFEKIFAEGVERPRSMAAFD